MRTLNKNLATISLLCLLCLLPPPAAALGAARSFMVALGSDPTVAPTTGPTALQMAPGSTVTIAVYLMDTVNLPQNDLLNGMQIVIPRVAAPLGGATGAITYIDNFPGMGGGDSVLLDMANPDWVFANVALADTIPFTYLESGTLLGMVYNLFFNEGIQIGPGTNVPHPAGPNYVCQFSMAVSPDASGVFELPFNVPPASPPLTAFFDPCCGEYGGMGYVTKQPLQITVVPCTSHTQCADTNSDGLRDDSCTWYTCEAGVCLGTSIPFADMGGPFGDCLPDLTVDGNDRFHALNCFSNQGTTLGAPYPCEASPPSATNTDACGPFRACCPDGVCDANDALQALHTFASENPCTCPANFACPCPVPTTGMCLENKGRSCTSDEDCGPGGACHLVMCPLGAPMPQAPGNDWPRVAGRSTVRLAAARKAVTAGELIDIDVFLEDAVADLRAYQLHVEATGGVRGALELVDIAVHERRDCAFAGLADWRAFNVQTRQMLAGLDSSGVASRPGAYLATFTFRASADAAGTFSIDLLHDDRDPAQRTFIFPTPAGAKIEIESTEAALITVAPAPVRARGRS